MARVLADTNIWLGVADTPSPRHRPAIDAVERLLRDGYEVWLCAQVLVEFWAVATRPTSVNGLGWTVAETAQQLVKMEQRFPLEPDTTDFFEEWKSLVVSASVSGKRTHDARLAAFCLVHRFDALLTLNSADSKGFAELNLLDANTPQLWVLP